MAISAIQNNNTNNNPKRASVIDAALIGGISGYALKWALPIMAQEKTQDYNAGLKEISQKAIAVRTQTYNNIRNSKNRTPASDTFIKMYDNKTLNPKEIKKLKEPLQSEIFGLRSGVRHKTKDMIRTGKRALESFTKSIRPTSSFVFLGMGLATAIAFIHNACLELNTNTN